MVVGFLILAGAVNTAIVGSSGVLSRVSEDGVLPAWFRQPHKRFGTNYRIINLIVVLQLATILVSRGDVFVLGEAYAFGVVWSFAFKALAVLVLRYTEPGHREWKVPFNLQVGRLELPIGLAIITIVLFAAAIVNIFTKEVATLSGVAFTLILYGSFVATEHTTAKRKAAGHLDQFQVMPSAEISESDVAARPGNVLVPVRDYNTLTHLSAAVHDHRDRDIVVMTARLMRGESSDEFHVDELFTDYEQHLFTNVVSVAEREGRPVKLLIVPSRDPYDGIAQTAFRLQSSEIVMGESANWSPAELARHVGDAWDRISGTRDRQTRLTVLGPNASRHSFSLGVHTPNLSPADLDLIHRLWLDAHATIGPGVHHHDVVAVALQEFAAKLSGQERETMLSRLRESTTRVV